MRDRKGRFAEGHTPWNLGIPRTKESKLKNRLAHLGKRLVAVRKEPRPQRENKQRVICVECGQDKPHYAKKLCSACYTTSKRDYNYQGRYYQAHREYYLEQATQYKKDHREAYNERQRIRKYRLKGFTKEIYHSLLDENRNKFGILTCENCLVNIEGNFQVDHIIPLSQGGDSSQGNLQLLCSGCNQEKYTHAIDFKNASTR